MQRWKFSCQCSCLFLGYSQHWTGVSALPIASFLSTASRIVSGLMSVRPSFIKIWCSAPQQWCLPRMWTFSSTFNGRFVKQTPLSDHALWVANAPLCWSDIPESWTWWKKISFSVVCVSSWISGTKNKWNALITEEYNFKKFWRLFNSFLHSTTSEINWSNCTCSKNWYQCL